jgi:hypothetical protein
LFFPVAITALIGWATSEFAVTNKRVLIETGWLRRHSLETLLSKVEAGGVEALEHNTIGDSNTANGVDALVNNFTGGNNTALGASAGVAVTTASNVICIGADVFGGREQHDLDWQRLWHDYAERRDSAGHYL